MTSENHHIMNTPSNHASAQAQSSSVTYEYSPSFWNALSPLLSAVSQASPIIPGAQVGGSTTTVGFSSVSPIFSLGELPSIPNSVQHMASLPGASPIEHASVHHLFDADSPNLSSSFLGSPDAAHAFAARFSVNELSAWSPMFELTEVNMSRTTDSSAAELDSELCVTEMSQRYQAQIQAASDEDSRSDLTSSSDDGVVYETISSTVASHSDDGLESETAVTDHEKSSSSASAHSDSDGDEFVLTSLGSNSLFGKSRFSSIYLNEQSGDENRPNANNQDDTANRKNLSLSGNTNLRKHAISQTFGPSERSIRRRTAKRIFDPSDLNCSKQNVQHSSRPIR